MRLSDLKIGQKAIITDYSFDHFPLLQKLLEMGLVKGSKVEAIQAAPFGDPLEVAVRGYRLSLRRAEASMIKIKETS